MNYNILCKPVCLNQSGRPVCLSIPAAWCPGNLVSNLIFWLFGAGSKFTCSDDSQPALSARSIQTGQALSLRSRIQFFYLIKLDLQDENDKPRIRHSDRLPETRKRLDCCQNGTFVELFVIWTVLIYIRRITPLRGLRYSTGKILHWHTVGPRYLKANIVGISFYYHIGSGFGNAQLKCERTYMVRRFLQDICKHLKGIERLNTPAAWRQPVAYHLNATPGRIL